MKNKESVIIAILGILVLVVAAILLFSGSNNDITFKLNGDEKMTIGYGDTYVEPGFIAKDKDGNDISSSVTVKGEVKSTSIGTYEIIYQLSYNDIRKRLTRYVTIGDIDVNKLKIVLNGEETVYLLKNGVYTEKGAYVVNSVNNQKFDLGKMDISNNINNKVSGVYTVTYKYTYNGKFITKTRKVEVSDINYVVSPTSITSGSVKISFDFRSVNNYSSIEFPNGKKSTDKQVNYEVTMNGDYNFTINFKDGDSTEKTISVNNIAYNYKCTGTVTMSGAKITITPTSNNIKSYEWVINNKTTKGTNTYNEYKLVKRAKVNVIYTNGQKQTVNCSVEDKLLYHFTYNLEDTGNWVKPEMKCDTYTASDKSKLDAKLKKTIEDAGGKGSRAGTVEAVRFLIGGLDYRIRYQAPRSTDASLGKYQKIGLNIGNSKAWGCRVGGYRNGFDCTHFVEWALYQTGFTAGPYSYPKTDTSKVIDKIKPGDLLYVVSSSGSLTHVAFVAGVDRAKGIYYVAESVPGYNNSDVGVTLHATKRATVLKAYTKVGNVPYTKEGKVTDMWLME